MSYNKGLINGLGDSQLVKNELVHLSPQNNENNLEINTSIKTETYDEYETNLTLENITISSLKLEIKDEFTESSVILATEKVIIKEELNIDEVLCDEPTTNLENWDENDPLAILPTSHNQKFSCEICFKNFTQNRDLTSHLFIIHRPLTLTGNGAYCNKCEKWLPETKYPNHIPCFKYMRSIQSGKRIYSCQICDKDFAPIRSFQDHLIEKHRPLIAHESVDISDMKITNKTMCRICNAFFARKNALVNHLTLMHRPYTISGEGAYCTRCQSWFPEHNFKDHRPCVIPLPDKIEIFNCSICGAYFQLANLLETHMWVIHRPLTLQYCSDAFCDKCNRWFKEENYLMHKCFRRTTENITNSTAKSYMCIICYKHFESETDIKKHLFNMHRPVVIAADCFDKIFCDVCTKCYDEDKFEMHVPCHSVDSKCVFCLMAMPSKEHFLEHDLTWKGWRSYQCNMCDLSTHDMRLADLYEHMICHGKKGVFQCVKCKYDYVSTKMLEAHIQCVHLGCLCDSEPCICFTFNYDYYYEFLKQRNMLGVNENLLENDIISMREEQYNLVESNIEVWHMKKANIKENNDYSIFIPSTSKATIMEDFSSNNSSGSDIDDENLIEDEVLESVKETEKIYCNERESVADIKIERGTQGFGFTLIGENPCKLGNVIPGSPADLAGLENNDSVIEINGCNVLSFAHDTVVSLIKRCAGKLHMKILFQMHENKENPILVPIIEPILVSVPVPETEPEQLNNIKLIRQHKQTKSPDTNRDKDTDTSDVLKIKDFYCSKCDQNFVEYLKLLYHDPCAVSKLKNCTVCFLCKPTLAHYELHNLLYREKQYVCTICPPLNRVTLPLGAMNEHRKTRHDKIGIFECLKCKIEFASFDEIKAHIMEHLKRDEIMDAHTYKLKQQMQLYKCKCCKKVMSTAKALEIHEQKHARKLMEKKVQPQPQQRNFACHLCESKFWEKKYLRQHLQIHNNEKKFICEECGQGFTYQTSLVCHVASHTKEDVFQCVVCNIKFDKQSKLGKHIKVHNNDQTNPNKCHICNRYFTHKCKLLVHLRMHRPPTLKENDTETKEMPNKTAERRSKRKRVQLNGYTENDDSDIECHEEQPQQIKVETKNIKSRRGRKRKS